MKYSHENVKYAKKKTHIKNKSYKHNIHLKMKIMKWKYWL